MSCLNQSFVLARCHHAKYSEWNESNEMAFVGNRSIRVSRGDQFMKALIAAVLVAAFATPALAADEFYVVQDVKTKKCTIVDKKPTTTETTVVGNGVYKTRTEAETGMKSVKVCTSN
jgi:hypothetical protein